MTVQDIRASASEASPTAIEVTLIILALARGAFAIGVGEFAIIGLLPEVAAGSGAWIGGRVIAHGFGYPATGHVGALLSLIGLGVFAVSYGLERRTKSAP